MPRLLLGQFAQGSPSPGLDSPARAGKSSPKRFTCLSCRRPCLLYHPCLPYRLCRLCPSYPSFSSSCQECRDTQGLESGLLANHRRIVGRLLPIRIRNMAAARPSCLSCRPFRPFHLYHPFHLYRPYPSAVAAHPCLLAVAARLCPSVE